MSRAQQHMEIVYQIGCVICREEGKRVPCQVHHVAEGSSKPSDYMTAGLCDDHHLGDIGIHGMGVKAFLNLFNLPTEYHLLGLVNKYRIVDGL